MINMAKEKYKKVEKLFNELLKFFYPTSDIAVNDAGIYLTVNYPDTLVFPYKEIDKMLNDHKGKEVAGYKWIIDYDVLLDENGVPVIENGQIMDDYNKPIDIWLYIGADEYTSVLKLFIEFFANKINNEGVIKLVDWTEPYNINKNIVSFVYLDKDVALKHVASIMDKYLKTFA